MHITLHNLETTNHILFRYTTGRIATNDHGHGIGIILLAISIQPPRGAAFVRLVFGGVIVFGKECDRAGGEIGQSNTIDAAARGGVGGGGLGPLEAVDKDAAEFVVTHGYLALLFLAGFFGDGQEEERIISNNDNRFTPILDRVLVTDRHIQSLSGGLVFVLPK